MQQHTPPQRMDHERPAADLIVVVGSINADIVLGVAGHPRPGETVIARSMEIHPGGKGANQAVAAARLGAAVALVGAVGDDSYAEAALSGLREARVDTGSVAVLPGPTGQAFVTVDEGTGENSIIVVPGANGRVDGALVRAHGELLERAAVVVLQGEVPPDAAAAAASASSTARLVLNLAPVIRLEREVILRADPLVVNQHEGRLALKMLCGEPGGSGTDESIVEALLAEGVRAVVVTLGANGALFSDDGGAVARVPAPAMDAVDTTGAGDAFVGALSSRLADGASIRDAVEFAVRVGSFTVGGRGAQPSYPECGDDLPE